MTRGRQMRAFHGARVGERAQAVYVCDRCGGWQVDARTQIPLIKAQLGYYCNYHNCTGTTFTHFDSKGEAKAFANLVLRVTAGEIEALEVHPRYDLHAPTPDGKGAKIGVAEMDFRYRDKKTGELVVIDCKGDADTHMSQWKRKHFEAEHGITVRIMKV